MVITYQSLMCFRSIVFKNNYIQKKKRVLLHNNKTKCM